MNQSQPGNLRLGVAAVAVGADALGPRVSVIVMLVAMAGYLGAAAFTALFGVLVTQIGYSPLFVVLAVFDLIAAAVVCLMARSSDKMPEPKWTLPDAVTAK